MCAYPSSVFKFTSCISGREKHPKSGGPFLNSAWCPSLPDIHLWLVWVSAEFPLDNGTLERLTHPEGMKALPGELSVLEFEEMARQVHQTGMNTRPQGEGPGIPKVYTAWTNADTWAAWATKPHDVELPVIPRPCSLLCMLLALPHLVTLAELQGSYSICFKTAWAKKERKGSVGSRAKLTAKSSQ